MSLYKKLKDTQEAKAEKKGFGSYLDTRVIASIYEISAKLGVSANSMVAEIISAGLAEIREEMSNGQRKKKR